MQTTPKSMRLQIGLFGRTNVGKSSFLNMIAGQDIAVTSEIPGTTTDVVEKSMELLPVGPVVFLDTAGIDDHSELSEARLKKTGSIYDRAEVFVIVTEPQNWTGFEEQIITEAKKRERPVLVVVNKIDKEEPSENFLNSIRKHTESVFCCSSIDNAKRSVKVTEFKDILISCLPDKRIDEPSIVGDLLPPGGLAVLIVPIDLQAPKGRLILPQVQTIRDALDNDASALIVKEREYAHLLASIGKKPDLVICDSQIVLKMIADTPPEIPCTTFSILFARFKADLCELATGAAAIERLITGDKVLIAEACSHHAAEDDIGRVKIPRWLRQYAGCDLQIDVCSGRDFPENLKDYKLIIHCGSCMFTRSETVMRMKKAAESGVAITNYGVAISFLQGVLEKVLSPFPAALDAYKSSMKLTVEN